MRRANSNTADHLAIGHLADRIISSFREGYATALRRVALHERYRELKSKQHRVKLAGRFIVIEGGLKETAETQSTGLGNRGHFSSQKALNPWVSYHTKQVLSKAHLSRILDTHARLAAPRKGDGLPERGEP